MYTYQLYDYHKLDSDGEWVLRDPAEVALAGSQFGNASNNSPPPTDQTNHTLHSIGTASQRRYPSPTIAFDTMTHPYWVQRPQDHSNAGGGHQGVAWPGSHPLVAGGMGHQETQIRRYLPRHGPVREVVDDGPSVDMSPAVRRVKFEVSETRRREALQHATFQHRPGPGTTMTPALGAPPPGQHKSVADWTMDQNQAFHLQVGNLRVNLRQQHPVRVQEPGRSVSVETENETEDIEPYPCRIRGCTSVHEPFVNESVRNKHEKIHRLPHGCSGCRHHKKFATLEELEQHRALEHSTSTQARAQCHLCPKSFARGDGLRRHFETGHPDYFAQHIAVNPRRRRASSARSSRTATTTAPGTPAHIEDHGLLSPPKTARAPRSTPYQNYSPPLDSPMQSPGQLFPPPSR